MPTVPTAMPVRRRSGKCATATARTVTSASASIAKRRACACRFCGARLYPCVGTPFEKSRTPLRNWFFALFTTTRHGIAAKELERQLGVTYETAWRMAHELRELMAGRRRCSAKARVTPDAKRRSPFIRANVRQGSVSDEWFACRNLGERGYRHEAANHGGGQGDGPATTGSRATG